jgi:hypothetical protein
MSDKHISKPVSSETYNNKQAKLISGSGLEDSASVAWSCLAAIAAIISIASHYPLPTKYWPLDTDH